MNSKQQMVEDLKVSVDIASNDQLAMTDVSAVTLVAKGLAKIYEDNTPEEMIKMLECIIADLRIDDEREIAERDGEA